MNQPVIAMIVAMSENRVIGVNNQLPWHISADLQHFKRTTMGKPILMGRKTYESIGRPLPGRTNIVLTRQAGFSPEGVIVVTDVDQAIAQALHAAEEAGHAEAMVIGGEQLYRVLLPRAQRVYLTEVHCSIEGDAYFPALEKTCWREVDRDLQHEGDYTFSFVTLDRIA